MDFKKILSIVDSVDKQIINESNQLSSAEKMIVSHYQDQTPKTSIKSLITPYLEQINEEVELRKEERRKLIKEKADQVLQKLKMKKTEGLKDPKDNPCWKGYKPVGTKKKGGKTVPNCVPKESQEYDSQEQYQVIQDEKSEAQKRIATKLKNIERLKKSISDDEWEAHQERMKKEKAEYLKKHPESIYKKEEVSIDPKALAHKIVSLQQGDLAGKDELNKVVSHSSELQTKINDMIKQYDSLKEPGHTLEQDAAEFSKSMSSNPDLKTAANSLGD